MGPRRTFRILVYLSYRSKRIRYTSAINLLNFFLLKTLTKMNSRKNSSSKKGESMFPCKLCVRILLTMMIQFYVTSMKHGSTSNVTILTILTTKIYKAVISHDTASLLLIHSFHLVNWIIRFLLPSLVMIILSPEWNKKLKHFSASENTPRFSTSFWSI